MVIACTFLGNFQNEQKIVLLFVKRLNFFVFIGMKCNWTTRMEVSCKMLFYSEFFRIYLCYSKLLTGI